MDKHNDNHIKNKKLKKISIEKYLQFNPQKELDDKTKNKKR